MVVTGGDTRQASVRASLAVVAEGTRVVVIHDAARPFASPDLFTGVIEGVDGDVAGVIPVVPVTDTVKRVHEGLVAGTLDREELGLAQTPQAFAAGPLRQAHARAAEADLLLTDDASVLEMAGHDIRVDRRATPEHEDHDLARPGAGRRSDGWRRWMSRRASAWGSTFIPVRAGGC